MIDLSIHSSSTNENISYQTFKKENERVATEQHEFDNGDESISKALSGKLRKGFSSKVPNYQISIQLLPHNKKMFD